MPIRCAIKNCRTTYNVSRVIGLNISFFAIPKDKDLLHIWLSKCNENTKATTAKVCSLHFQPDDFDRDLRAELLQLKPRALLKRTAIPSKKLGPSQENAPNISTNPSAPLQINPSTSLEMVLEKPLLEVNDVPNILKSSIACQTEAVKITDDINLLKSKIKNLEKENDDLRSKLHCREVFIKKIRRQHKVFNRNSQREYSKKVNFALKNKLQHIFTPKQLEKIIQNKRTVKWGEEDIANAFTLRYLSNQRCYQYLRNHLNYPLPGISTVKSWCKTVNKQAILNQRLTDNCIVE